MSQQTAKGHNRHVKVTADNRRSEQTTEDQSRHLKSQHMAHDGTQNKINRSKCVNHSLEIPNAYKTHSKSTKNIRNPTPPCLSAVYAISPVYLYGYVIRLSVVCAISPVCLYGYVIRLSVVCAISPVYLYGYVIRLSVVCAMSPVYLYGYVIRLSAVYAISPVCLYGYVIRLSAVYAISPVYLYGYVIRLSVVCAMSPAARAVHLPRRCDGVSLQEVLYRRLRVTVFTPALLHLPRSRSHKRPQHQQPNATLHA